MKRFKRSAGWASICAAATVMMAIGAGSLLAQQPALNLMPMPANVQAGSGELAIERTFSVSLTG
ncbi:MAG TPA: hypothetical protein VKF79_07185, partial [Candidatus Acidoferrum sp.]|nr:hypothetical protein [Candidatus Acidoferrum sp.]